MQTLQTARENLTEQLLDKVGTGIYIVHEAKIVYSNALFQEMTGYTEEELSGKYSLNQVHPEDREVVRQKAIENLKGRNTLPYEYRFIRKNGEYMWVLEKVASIEYAGKRACLGSFMNITDQKRNQEERENLLEQLHEINYRLNQSNKELQDFVYVASHDLREPLRKITSFGMLLEESLENKLDDDGQENLEFMIDGARRMQEMVDDLLVYSRVITGAKQKEQVDLNKVIDNLENLELAAMLAETGGTINIPKPLPVVRAEATQIYQLLQNLIGNGLKFHRPDVPPEITISYRLSDTNSVYIEVKDNGIGIDEQYHDQIFTMFKRLHPRTQFDGTGIGLAICKKIIIRHDGDIGITSTPGEGSTFWFTLPF
jgi:PAS domain S-box-containing protein